MQRLRRQGCKCVPRILGVFNQATTRPRPSKVPAPSRNASRSSASSPIPTQATALGGSWQPRSATTLKRTSTDRPPSEIQRVEARSLTSPVDINDDGPERTGAVTSRKLMQPRGRVARRGWVGDRTPKAVLTLYTAQDEGVKPADWSRRNAEPGAVGVQPSRRASRTAAATRDGSTGSVSRPSKLLGCGWLVVTTSVISGASACSTANVHGDQARPWKYVGLPRGRQRYAVPINNDPS